MTLAKKGRDDMLIRKILLLLTAVLTLCTGLSGCDKIGIGDRTVNINVPEGELADGFTWVDHYSEITITGYKGMSNDLVIPDQINGKPVTEIQAGAFNGFSSLNSIIISENIRTIGRNAFYDCTGLKQLTLKEGLETISEYAFYNCTSLESVELPSTLTSVKQAFINCSSLSDITIQPGITSLDNAFYMCTGLKSIVIPDGVTDLSNAFSGCTSLENVVIPDSVTNMENTFSGCTSLTYVALPAGVKMLNGTFYMCSAITEFDVPNGVEELVNTFSGCTSLKKVTLPDTLTTVSSPFSYCTALEELEYPDSITLFSDDLKGLTSLKILRLPSCYNGYFSLEQIPNIQKIDMPEDYAPYAADTDISVEWTLCEDNGEDWYDDLYSKAETDMDYSYYYESVQLDDGTPYSILKSYDDNSKYCHEEETYDEDGTTVTKTFYAARLSRDRDNPAVICKTRKHRMCIFVYNIINDSEIVSDSIIINGTEYPIIKN